MIFYFFLAIIKNMKKTNHKKLASSKIFNLPVIFQEESEGGFTVFAPSLPGCVTFGKNLKHAKAMAKEAIELYFEDMIEEKEFTHFEHATYLTEIQVEVPQSKSLAHA